MAFTIAELEALKQTVISDANVKLARLEAEIQALKTESSTSRFQAPIIPHNPSDDGMAG